MLVSAIHQHESAIDIHMSLPSWSSLPSPTPSYLSRLLQSTSLSSLSCTAKSHRLSILHTVVYMFPCYSLHSTLSFLPPAYVHKSVLYVCVSMVTLQISSSVISFLIPYIYVLTYNICFFTYFNLYNRL